MLPAAPCLLLSAWEDRPLPGVLPGHGTAHEGGRGSAKNGQCPLGLGASGAWSPSWLCSDPPCSKCPALPLPMAPTAPARNAKPPFVSLPRILPPGQRAQWWQMDRQTDGCLRAGPQPTCGGVDAPEVKEQHCRVREVERHLEERPRKGQR